MKRENKAPYIQNLGSGQLVVGNTMEQNGTRENYIKLKQCGPIGRH
jgi:hypothetical protein